MISVWSNFMRWFNLRKDRIGNKGLIIPPSHREIIPICGFLCVLHPLKKRGSQVLHCFFALFRLPQIKPPGVNPLSLVSRRASPQPPPLALTPP